MSSNEIDQRGTLPAEDIEPAQASSYGQFLADPPYVTDTMGTAGSDAGTPPVMQFPPTPHAAYDLTPDRPNEAVPLAADTGTLQPVSCPECGAAQEIRLNRRDAVDFCRKCDFPLFWTPTNITWDRGGFGTGESLRRLPGTVGRTSLASVPCPHCAELNTVSAELCIRCGLSMHPVVYEEPPPVYLAPEPPPVVVIETKDRVPWWVWLALALVLATVIVVALVLTNVLD